MSINEINFDFFFPRLALVHKPRRVMGFLLILKELSHGGKNLSYLSLISKLCGHFHPLPNDCVFCKKLKSA